MNEKDRCRVELHPAVNNTPGATFREVADREAAFGLARGLNAAARRCGYRVRKLSGKGGRGHLAAWRHERLDPPTGGTTAVATLLIDLEAAGCSS